MGVGGSIRYPALIYVSGNCLQYRPDEEAPVAITCYIACSIALTKKHTCNIACSIALTKKRFFIGAILQAIAVDVDLGRYMDLTVPTPHR